jgi:hypothetical protein
MDTRVCTKCWKPRKIYLNSPGALGALKGIPGVIAAGMKTGWDAMKRIKNRNWNRYFHRRDYRTGSRFSSSDNWEGGAIPIYQKNRTHQNDTDQRVHNC